jgi:hypothetical protein
MEKYRFNQFCLKYFVGEGGTWATVGSPGSAPRRGSPVGGTIPAGLRGTRHERVLNRICTGLRLVLALAAFPLPFPTSNCFPQLPDQSKTVCSTLTNQKLSPIRLSWSVGCVPLSGSQRWEEGAGTLGSRGTTNVPLSTPAGEIRQGLRGKRATLATILLHLEPLHRSYWRTDGGDLRAASVTWRAARVTWRAARVTRRAASIVWRAAWKAASILWRAAWKAASIVWRAAWKAASVAGREASVT